MRIADGENIVFIGDSITDCDRVRPVGQYGGLGEGYVACVDSLLAAWYPQRRIRILNTGTSGNRVIDLEARWKADVLDLRPDWLSVMIGINDVWRQFDSALEADQVSIERYEAVYRRLLAQVRPRLKGLVLMAPYFIESNLANPMRERMDAYGKVVGRLSAEFDAVFVDVQAAFDRYLLHRPTQSLSSDRVHPNKAGHMIIATAFLTRLEFDWNLASKPSDCAR
jgi:lysophospholipase L1-like esterase